MATGNKVALITGANKGIGLETARQLGKQGITILIGARDETRGQEAAAKLLEEKIDARFLQINPTDEASVTRAAAQVEKEFGRLDILVNNAGVLLPGDAVAPSQVPVSVLRDTYDINVFGLAQVVHAFWPLLNKSEAARLVNVSSLLGSLQANSEFETPFGAYKLLAYNSSKAAVNMLTLHYAFEWKNTAHKANTIHPGSVLTDMNPQGTLDLPTGAKTSVDLATVGPDGPNGGFFHLGETLAW